MNIRYGIWLIILTWPKNGVLTWSDLAVAAADNPTGATFKIKDSKLNVPVVTLATEDDNKLLERLKIGFRRTIK